MLLSVAALSVPLLLAQEVGRQPPGGLGVSAIGGVSVGADYAGREALCEEFRLMSTRAKDVRILSENSELHCDANGSLTFSVILNEAPASVDQFVCDFVDKPSSLIFYQMRAIALRSGSTVTPPEELSEKLQPLGVRNLGSLLGAFDFVQLEVRRAGAKGSIREIGVHELHLLCEG
jgi:hypothetical protein